MARAIKARSADATARITRLHTGIGGARAVVALVRPEALPTTARVVMRKDEKPPVLAQVLS